MHHKSYVVSISPEISLIILINWDLGLKKAFFDGLIVFLVDERHESAEIRLTWASKQNSEQSMISSKLDDLLNRHGTRPIRHFSIPVNEQLRDSCMRKTPHRLGYRRLRVRG
jgi:hypothetical protein